MGSLISHGCPSSKAMGINKEKHMGICQKNQRESGWRPVIWESDQAWGEVGQRCSGWSVRVSVRVKKERGGTDEEKLGAADRR